MQDKSNTQKYNELIKLKRYFLLRFFLVPALFLFAYDLFITALISGSWARILTVALCLVFLYINLFHFLAKDNCPWCKCNFFMDGFAQAPNLIFRKKCINCGMPHDVMK